MKGYKKKFRGKVVSNKMEKSAVLLVETLKSHPTYHKKIRWSKRYMFHDEDNAVNENDEVEIIESKPYSKRKKFSFVRFIKKAPKN